MKNIKNLFTALLFLCTTVASAYDFEVGGIYYNITDVANRTVEVTSKYYCAGEIESDYEGDITIPETVNYRGTIYRVTSIGMYAFYNCTGLKSIVIGNSVTSIGEHAFFGCTGLTNIVIPNSVTSIGYEAFEGCTGLTNIEIPNSVTSIGNSAFCDCSGLTSVVIPNSVTSIGSSAFSGTAWYENQPDGVVYAGKVLYKYKGEMPDNTSITVKDGTLGIAGDAFYGCKGLTSVEIPNNVTSIGDGAFQNCSGLSSIEIPNSVTSIGDDAFYKCTGLTSVTIGNSVTSIGNDAFYGCTGLTSIEIPNSVTYIGESAFDGCTGLTSIEIPSSVTHIGDYAFKGTVWYKNQPDGVVYAGKILYKYKGEMPENTSIVVKKGTLGIGGSAFYDCSGLTSIEIPNSITRIGDYAFYDCSGLTSIEIPNSITSIGDYAFYGCTGLTSIEIPNSVTYIGDYVFDGCTGLTSIEIPNSVTYIGDYAFFGCTGLTSIEIPNSVTSIGDYAFYGCTGLTSIEIPNSVTYIGESAFDGCTGLTSIEIPNSVTYIGESAFDGCGLTSIVVAEGNSAYDSRNNCNAIIETATNTLVLGCKNTVIPNSVTYIGDYAFFGCTGLTSIEIPNSVTCIGYEAFEGCSNLKTVINLSSLTLRKGEKDNGSVAYYADKVVNAPNGRVVGDFVWAKNNRINTLVAYLGGASELTLPADYNGRRYVIGEGAFSGCSGLTSVTISDCVTRIGDYAFYGCTGLTSIEIPNSAYIGESAFYGCSRLKSVIIPYSVTSIGSYAFSGCSSLKTVINLSSLTLGKGEENNGCVAYYADKVINAPNGCIDGDFVWSKINGVNTLVAYLGSASELASPTDYNGGSYIIGENAFSGCSGLTSIEIPNSVTRIGDNAFKGCSRLKKVEINCASVGNWFSGLPSIQEVVLGDGVTSIRSGAFEGCKSLTSIEIPNSVTYIGESAFYGCSRLTSVIIGTGVTEIGYYAFNSCNLKKAIWLTNTPPTGYKNIRAEINYVANKQYSELYNTKVYPYLSSLFEVGGVKYVPVSPAERTCNAIDCSYSNVTDVVIDDKVMFKGIAMSVEEVMPYTLYGNKNIKSLKLNNCGGIGNYAISTCSNLTSATIGNNVTSIGSGVFSDCKNLESVTIPDCVSSVEDAVFMGCSALKSVMLGNGVEYIGKKAFSGCSSLKGIRIPCSVYSVGNYAFDDCSSLVNVVFEDGTATLQLGSNGSVPLFSDCPLDSVYIGRKITYETSGRCGYSPFYRNTSLRTVVVTDAETEICDNEFYGCSKLKNISVGNGITRIGNWAFSGCSSLDCVVLGENVASVGEEAFSDCANVTRILSKAKTPPTCGTQALDDINKWECVLSVPNEAKGKYQAASQWRDFFFIEDLQHP